MAQAEVWDKEYSNPKFLSNSYEPQLDFKHFIKWLKKHESVNLIEEGILDLGSGNGKNSIYLAERGAHVTGIEISQVAVGLAKQVAKEKNLDIIFLNKSIGDKWDVQNQSMDIIIDVLSSNSLSQRELTVYLQELKRVLKPDGYIYIKALCLDGDKNAQTLLSKFPGKEPSTYVMPETRIVERVFNKEVLEETYRNFKILHLEKKSSYTIFQGKPFKRNFWLVYAQNS